MGIGGRSHGSQGGEADVKNDKYQNAAVRMKALEGLQPYIAEDMRVRDAVLESLMKDSDPRVRLVRPYLDEASQKLGALAVGAHRAHADIGYGDCHRRRSAAATAPR